MRLQEDLEAPVPMTLLVKYQASLRESQSMFYRRPLKMFGFALPFPQKTSYYPSKIFILSFILRLAACVAVNLPVHSSDLLLRAKVYQPNPEHPQCYCTDSLSWLSPGFVKDDCYAAMNRMRDVETVVHGKQSFKFMAHSASPMPGLPLMGTPRTYTSSE